MYDCVIAAAGASSRMGSLKALLPFRGRSIVETTVANALEAGCRVLLVLGNRGDEIAALFRGRDEVLPVWNPAWERGLLGSLQAGLLHVRGEACFLIHADMPFVPAPVYGILAGARSRLDGRVIPAEAPRGSDTCLVASWQGRAGHPVLLPSPWIPEILALDPGDRMNRYLSGKPGLLVETGTESVLADIDTPEDYSRLVGSLP